MNKIKSKRVALIISQRTMAKLLHITIKEYKAFESDIDASNAYLCLKACRILEVPFNEI